MDIMEQEEKEEKKNQKVRIKAIKMKLENAFAFQDEQNQNQFLQLLDNVILTFAQLSHEATYFGDGFIRYCIAHQKTLPLQIDQAFYRHCLNIVTNGSKKPRDYHRASKPQPTPKNEKEAQKQREAAEQKADKEKVRKANNASYVAEMNSFYKKYWTPTDVDYKYATAGLSQFIAPIAVQLATNAENSFWMPFANRQKSALRHQLHEVLPLTMKPKEFGKLLHQSIAFINRPYEYDDNWLESIPDSLQEIAPIVLEHREYINESNTWINETFLKKNQQAVLRYYYYLNSIQAQVRDKVAAERKQGQQNIDNNNDDNESSDDDDDDVTSTVATKGSSDTRVAPTFCTFDEVKDEKNAADEKKDEPPKIRRRPKVKAFTLLPLRRYSRASLPISNDQLWQLFKKLNWTSSKREIFTRNAAFHWRSIFKIQDNSDNKWQFHQNVTTDGVSISLLYSRPLSSSEQPVETKKQTKRKTPSDADADADADENEIPLQKLQDFSKGLFTDKRIQLPLPPEKIPQRIIAVDPGSDNLMTWYDDLDDNSEANDDDDYILPKILPNSSKLKNMPRQKPRQTFKWTKKEYYQKCGMNGARRTRERWFANADKELQAAQVTSSEQAFRGANFEQWARLWKVRALLEKKLWRLYGAKRYRGLRYSVFRQKRIHMDNKYREIIYGARAYRKMKWKTYRKNRKHITKEFKDTLKQRERETVIAFGAAKFPTTRKGDISGPCLGLVKHLRHRCRVVYIDEYLTSQVCSRCKTKWGKTEAEMWSYPTNKELVNGYLEGKEESSYFIDKKGNVYVYEPVVLVAPEVNFAHQVTREELVAHFISNLDPHKYKQDETGQYLIKSRVYSMKRCLNPSCSSCLHRDRNAAVNIHTIARSLFTTGIRPFQFERPDHQDVSNIRPNKKLKQSDL